MPLIGLSFFILGLVVASVAAEETSTDQSGTVSGSDLDDDVTVITTPSDTANITIIITNITSSPTNITTTTNSISTSASITSSISTATSTMKIPSTTNTMIASTTKYKGDKNSEDGDASQNAMTTPKPIGPSTKGKGTTSSQKTSDSTGIVILVVIILIAVVFGIACFFARKRQRRYSVDLTSRPDEANIPLSTMEPELHIDTVSQNGLQTFESVETAAKEPQEPEAKPEAQEEPKAEADKSAVDPSAESAAPEPTPDSSEDKPKEDVVEPSPPAPVGPSVEEKTDDEGIVSTKTSVESLKETNENNSNNADVSQKRDLKSRDLFWDVPLNCPV